MAAAEKSLLRFITCGSVDDGKSTLIGRLLFDAQVLPEDHLAVLDVESQLANNQSEDLEFSMLVDGLSAEREQGITIDVAYRYFATPKRKFIVADTPGHEQYTRNMATGASTAALAVLLVDARKGIVSQTRRHAFIVKTLGIGHVVLAVNKMDLVGYAQADFAACERAFEDLAQSLGLETVVVIPVSGKKGDNVVAPSPNMDWYQGPTLLTYLETSDAGNVEPQDYAFRFPVQRAVRTDSLFRGAAGHIVAGQICVGDKVTILPSAVETSISQIVTFDSPLQKAETGQAVTLVFSDEVDCPRGACVVRSDARAAIGQHFDVRLIWLSKAPSQSHHRYLLKLGPQHIFATLSAPDFKYCFETLTPVPTPMLQMNDIGSVQLVAQSPLIADPFTECPEMGRFVLIDRNSHETVAAGIIQSHVRTSQNVHWQNTQIDQTARAAQKNQQPFVLWFTGLSGSGKSTIASRVEQRLFDLGKHCFILDGDNVRHGLCNDLGFDDQDRRENIRRVGEVAKLMTEAGLIVLAAFISPFANERDMVRSILPEGQFLEVFVDVSLEIAEKRDTKGLYARARAGDIKNFTGIDSPFEVPSQPDLVIQTDAQNIDDSVDLVLRAIAGRLGMPTDLRLNASGGSN